MEATAQIRWISPGPIYWFDTKVNGVPYDVHTCQEGDIRRYIVQNVITHEFVTYKSSLWIAIVAACHKQIPYMPDYQI